MIKVIRFSNFGFKAQYQDYHINYINYLKHNYNNQNIPYHLKQISDEIRVNKIKFFKQNEKDLSYGI